MNNQNGNLLNKLVICPYCGCDAWFIRANHVQCFVCRALFAPKDIIAKKNVYSINMNLRFLKDVSDFKDHLEEE